MEADWEAIWKHKGPACFGYNRNEGPCVGSEADSECQQRGRNLAASPRTPVSGDFPIGVRVAPEPWQVVRG